MVRGIFKRHTDLVEPLSLDEAYLDVTENKTGLPTATRVASAIREQIRQELNLTASAGVAPNKFLAKIASDWRKPDGLFVIQPGDVDNTIAPPTRSETIYGCTNSQSIYRRRWRHKWHAH
jgi:DNA polymerase-4